MFYKKAKKDSIEKLIYVEERYNRLGKSANDAAINLYNVRKSASLAIGYNGSICATHFGVTVPPISVQFVPVISV